LTWSIIPSSEKLSRTTGLMECVSVWYSWRLPSMDTGIQHSGIPTLISRKLGRLPIYPLDRLRAKDDTISALLLYRLHLRCLHPPVYTPDGQGSHSGFNGAACLLPALCSEVDIPLPRCTADLVGGGHSSTGRTIRMDINIKRSEMITLGFRSTDAPSKTPIDSGPALSGQKTDSVTD